VATRIANRPTRHRFYYCEAQNPAIEKLRRLRSFASSLLKSSECPFRSSAPKSKAGLRLLVIGTVKFCSNSDFTGRATGQVCKIRDRPGVRIWSRIQTTQVGNAYPNDDRRNPECGFQYRHQNSHLFPLGFALGDESFFIALRKFVRPRCTL
jgi:hypothetical protein